MTRPLSHPEDIHDLHLEQLFEAVRNRPRRTLAVPSAEGASIGGLAEAYRAGICDTILIGDPAKLDALRQTHAPTAPASRVEAEPDPDRAVDRALALVRAGEANMLMKGKTDTPTLLKAVLDADKGRAPAGCSATWPWWRCPRTPA